MPVHDRGVGRHVEKFVGMPRHETDRISVEDVEKPLGVDRIMVDLESRCGRIEYLRMHGNDDGGRLVHVRQVFRQPVQLLGGEALDIVAGSAPVVAAAINVVHDDVMDLADVERIVGRADLIHIFDRRIVVRPGLEVVVMVAHGVEDLQILDLAVDGVQVLGEIVAVRIPVEVPGHVPEGERIHLLALVAGHVVRKVGGELGELSQVARSVGEVHVAQHEDLVGVLSVDLFELEVGPFDDVGAVFERAVELREHPDGRNFVAARDGDEDISPLFGRFELVDALLVRDGHLRAVGDHDVLHADAGRRHDPVDRGACIRFEIYVFDDVDVDSSERFFARVSFDEDFVVTRFTPVGQAYGETVGRGVDDGADVGDACVRLKNECVCG